MATVISVAAAVAASGPATALSPAKIRDIATPSGTADSPAAPDSPTASALPSAPESPAVPAAPATSARPAAPAVPAAALPAADCLPSGDGYFRARVAGAIDAMVDWPNNGTECQGESKSEPPGVRLSFHRHGGGTPDLLFVFGLTGVRRGEAAHEAATNLTLIVQGTNQIYGTLGDTRCTVDSLTQRLLRSPDAYRIEARGFCTQPAHALRGNGTVLVSTFEFAGLVNFVLD